MLAFTLFSYPEYVCTTYQFASDICYLFCQILIYELQIDISQLTN